MSATAPRAAAQAAVSLLALVQALEAELCSVLLERQEVVRGLLLALLSRTHLLLLGPPGTGKSMSVNAVQARVAGARLFQVLLTRFSEPGELFGPLDLPALERGEHRRATASMLPEAELVFLDEIFKSNSSILNALLGALNERTWRNGQALVSLPLVSCVGASNELPQGEDLSALYDRFLQRHWVAPLGEDASFAALLTLPRATPPAVTLTLADLAAAQAEVAAVRLTPATVAEIAKLRQALSRDGIRVSDRRWRESMPILRAQAWLEGRSEVNAEDLQVLAHVLWSDPAERSKVQAAVLGCAIPALVVFVELLDKAFEQHRLARAATDEDVRLEHASKLRKLADEAQKLAKGETHPRVLATLAKVVAYRDEIRRLVAS